MEGISNHKQPRQDGNDPTEVRISVDTSMFNGVRISEMRKMKPTRLRESAGGEFCCIFRAPCSRLEEHAEAYWPRIVSIGPYHHGLDVTNMMEEHKWRYLNSLLRRLEEGPKRVGSSFVFEQITQIEKHARECYSEEIPLSGDEFAMMLLLDGCFMVELLGRYGGIFDKEKEDPIFNCPWILPFMLRDLIKLENQLPFFVLEQIYDLYKGNGSGNEQPPFTALAFQFFESVLPRPTQIIEMYNGVGCVHVLDLLRSSFMPLRADRPKEENSSADVIQCAIRLEKAGIKFMAVEGAESFLEISFNNGVLKIPRVTVDDFHASFVKNCVAFEQSYHQCMGFYFTAYVTFLGRLIDTEKDVGLLIDNKIISHFLGNEKEVARFYNDIGNNHVRIDIKRCYLSRSFEEVCKYYANINHIRFAEFRSLYFSSPWSFLSAITALVLLLLTVAQTVFAVLSLGGH